MMTEKDQNIWDLIASVIDRTATAEELNSFDIWLNESQENRKTYELIECIGYDGEIDQSPLVKNAIFYKTQHKIFSAQFKRIRMLKYIAAASVILFIGISSWMYFESNIRGSSPVIETATAYGVKSTITLSDGTTVNLNAGSSLKYPVKFKGKERAVLLKGEAYFMVTKNAKHPFVVQTESINITVHGTRFNVRAFSDEDQLITTLLEGSVRLTNAVKNVKSKNIVMMPGQQAVYNKHEGKMLLRAVDGNQYISWTSGSYYFENKSLEDISKELERGFNVHIHIASNDLKKMVFSGIFDKGESLSRILNIMKSHHNLNFKSEQDTIVIYNYQQPVNK